MLGKANKILLRAWTFLSRPLVCFVSSGPLLQTGTEEPYRACVRACVCECVCLIFFDPKTSTMGLNRLNLCCIVTGNKLYTPFLYFPGEQQTVDSALHTLRFTPLVN